MSHFRLELGKTTLADFIKKRKVRLLKIWVKNNASVKHIPYVHGNDISGPWSLDLETELVKNIRWPAVRLFLLLMYE